MTSENLGLDEIPRAETSHRMLVFPSGGGGSSV